MEPLPEGLSSGDFPDIDRGVRVAFPAEDHRIAVAASVAPDVEDPAFLAQRLSASVAKHDGLVFSTNLANSACDDLNHDRLPKIFSWAFDTGQRRGGDPAFDALVLLFPDGMLLAESTLFGGEMSNKAGPLEKRFLGHRLSVGRDPSCRGQGGKGLSMILPLSLGES